MPVLPGLSRCGAQAGPDPFAFLDRSGLRGTGFWYFGGRDTAGDYTLGRLRGEGAVEVLYVVPRDDEQEAAPIEMHLSVRGDRLFAAHVDAPFEVISVTVDGQVEAITTVALPDPYPQQVAGDELWIGLAMIPLDSGFVRTFADLRGDTRLLVTYNMDGSVQRAGAIGVALGFVGRGDKRPVLLATRTTDRTEIVGYRWRWGEETTHQE